MKGEFQDAGQDAERYGQEAEQDVERPFQEAGQDAENWKDRNETEVADELYQDSGSRGYGQGGYTQEDNDQGGY